jgi:hypothetical protein
MAINYNPKSISDSLIFWLDAANIKSYPGTGSRFTDLSGSGNNGSTSATFSTLGKASFYHNGTYTTVDSYNIPALSFGYNSFSVNFWMYATNWGEGRSDGIVEQKLNDDSTGWTIYNDGGYPNKINARLTYQSNFPSTNNVVNNTWQNWTLVRNSANSTLTWYFNGKLDSTIGDSSYINDSSSTFRIGYSQTWSGYFMGNIANMQIYSRALSATEVTQNFNAYRGRFSI